MRRRKYSDDYRDHREHYSPDLNPLEQIARTAMELQKIIGTEYFDFNISKSANNNTKHNYQSNNLNSDGLDGKFYSLCISKLPHHLSDYDVRDIIYREFESFEADFNVKFSKYNGQRVVYINFRSSRDASNARRFLRNFRMDDRLVHIEPIIQKNKSPKSGRSRSPIHYYMNNNNNSSNNNSNNNNNNNQKNNYDNFNSRSSHTRTDSYRQASSNIDINPSNARSHFEDRESSNNNNAYIPSRSSNNSTTKTSSHFKDSPITQPTRTLFVGNLPMDVKDSELKRLFNKYGHITDIDIKKPSSSRQSNSYAFIKFENLEVATQAKMELSGKVFRKCQLKIGFGKVNPTNCVWVGGLGPWILYDSFEKEMSRFGTVKKINWPQNKSYAYVLYDSVDIAISVVNHLRGSHFGDEKKLIKVDFADSSCGLMDDRSKMIQSSQIKCNISTDDDSLSTESAASISQLINCLTDVWTGMIVLKNNNFGCRLYMLKGERTLIKDLLCSYSDSDDNCFSKVGNLTITQRMKLDSQKLSEMTQRMELAGENGFCLLLASSYFIDNNLITDHSQPQRPLKNLITYLRTKESAGVIFLKSDKCSSSGVLHAFPPCEYSFNMLLQKSPKLTKDFLRDDFLVILLLRNSN